jgi:GNAT superfamily N-acetyltransferase
VPAVPAVTENASAELQVEPLAESNAPAWIALFEACGCTCYCHYWHFGGSKNEWLARCFHDPAANREDQLTLVRAGALEARGLLALAGDAGRAGAGTHPGAPASGWMKLAPRERLPKLRRQGAYRALDLGDDEGIWSIGCFLVHPAYRRLGVARALVEAAPRHVKAWGGRAIEAYPHRTDHPLHDEEAWMGPQALFVAAGYAPVHDVAPYPVYRKTL